LCHNSNQGRPKQGKRLPNLHGEDPAIAQPQGHLKGLKPSQLKKLEAIFRRRVVPTLVVSPELARTMCEISGELNRQVGVLVDRRGHVQQVFVGDASRLHLPDLDGFTPGHDRFNGLRYIHTHLKNEPLNGDDLSHLAMRRFDLVAAVSAAGGLPGHVHLAHLLPHNPQGERYRLLDAPYVQDLNLDFLATIDRKSVV